MGIKKRNKVHAQFNMSSLTDIIFLLLIFFMLTSTLVAPNALNLKLPGKSNPGTVSTSPPDVSITRSGVFYLDGKRMSRGILERQLSSMARGQSRKLDITISPAKGTPVEHVVAVMDITMRNNINAILATEK